LPDVWVCSRFAKRPFPYVLDKRIFKKNLAFVGGGAVVAAAPFESGRGLAGCASLLGLGRPVRHFWRLPAFVHCCAPLVGAYAATLLGTLLVAGLERPHLPCGVRSVVVLVFTRAHRAGRDVLTLIGAACWWCLCGAFLVWLCGIAQAWRPLPVFCSRRVACYALFLLLPSEPEHCHCGG